MNEALIKVRNISQVKTYEAYKKDLLVNDLRSHWSNSKTLTKKYPNFIDYLKSRQEKKPDIIEFQFNINSSDHLKELLVERMGLPVLKYTATGGISTDDSVLEEYAKSNKFCEQLQEYRTLSHLKSTFLDGIEDRLSIVDARAHTDYLLHGTTTGRPSSRNPNLNNIPRTGTAEDIKDIFCSDRKANTPNGWGDWLLEYDLGQAEFRFWIQYAQDPQALYDLRMGIDIHRLMAAAGKGRIIPSGNLTWEQYQELIHDVTKKERQNAKLVVFGIMYGRGAESVSIQLGITITQAQTIIAQFFTRYAKARQFLIDTVAIARRDGYIVNFFGRRRRLLEINSQNDQRRSEAERQAYNSPIQGGASDLVLHNMVRIFKKLWKDGYKTRLVLTVYDSLIFNIPDNELEKVVKLVHYEMSHPPFEAITVPFTAEGKLGTHWGSLTEIDPDKAEWSVLYKKALETEKKEDFKWKNAIKFDLYAHWENGCAWVQPVDSPISSDGCTDLQESNLLWQDAKEKLENLQKEHKVDAIDYCFA
jgi:DNA polymerase-1